MDFPSTHWSLLLQLRDPASPQFQQHLSTLIQRYWKPAFAYLRALRRVSVDEAMDLTQEFFTRLLEKGYLEHISVAGGSFRGYLKTALRHFSISAARAEQVRRPRDGGRLFQVDPRELDPGAPDGAPDDVFDREWARGVLMQGIRDLEQALARDGKQVYFDLFRAYFLEPSGLQLRPETTEHLGGESPEASYDALAQKYGLAVHDVRNYLWHAKQTLRRILKDAVREYLGPGDDPEAELLFVLSR